MFLGAWQGSVPAPYGVIAGQRRGTDFALQPQGLTVCAFPLTPDLFISWGPFCL